MTLTQPRPSPPVAAPRRLDAESNGMSLTPAEFDAVTDYDDDYLYELVRGLVIVSPIPRAAHEAPIDILGYLLWKYRKEHPQGAALDKTLPGRYIHTPLGHRRRADRVVWCGLGREPDEAADVPQIAVEIVSRSRRDRRRDFVEKRAEYAAAGVAEYWIIDRFRRTMTVSFRDGSERAVAEDETYTTALLPGFELRPADLPAAAE